MTRALITGMTGFVGSHLLDFLLANTNWEVHGLARWSDPLDNIEHHIPRLNDKDGIFLHYGDLNDQTSLEKIIEKVYPDYVFHLAGQSYPKTSFAAPIDTLSTNILGTCRLFEALKTFAPTATIHNCASSEIFGRVGEAELPIDENCRLHPASPYAISKAGVDLLGRFYAEAYSMRIMTTRMFTHSGPRRGDVFAESSFAKQIAMIEAGLQKPEIKVGNLKSKRTYADVRDAVRAYYMLVTINPQPGECYNIGGDYSCAVGDMLRTLIRLSGIGQPAIAEDPERIRPLDADLQIPDTSKFRAHAGWAPEISFEQTMLDLLNFWRTQVEKKGAFLNR